MIHQVLVLTLARLEDCFGKATLLNLELQDLIFQTTLK